MLNKSCFTCVCVSGREGQRDKKENGNPQRYIRLRAKMSLADALLCSNDWFSKTLPQQHPGSTVRAGAKGVDTNSLSERQFWFEQTSWPGSQCCSFPVSSIPPLPKSSQFSFPNERPGRHKSRRGGACSAPPQEGLWDDPPARLRAPRTQHLLESTSSEMHAHCLLYQTK